MTAGATTIAGTCGGAVSPEQVFSFTQTTTGPFLATVAPSRDGGTMRPVIYVRAACATQADIACKMVNASEPKSLSINVLDAGTYFLVVDGYGPQGTSGPYTLSAFQGQPPGDSCTSSPRIVTMGSNTHVVVVGDNTGMSGDFAASCFGPMGRDVVYAFTAPRTGTLTVESFATFDAALSASGGSPCDGGAELACSDVDVGGVQGDERISFGVVSGTTYWVWMAGYAGNDTGPYQLVFDLP